MARPVGPKVPVPVLIVKPGVRLTSRPSHRSLKWAQQVSGWPWEGCRRGGCPADPPGPGLRSPGPLACIVPTPRREHLVRLPAQRCGESTCRPLRSAPLRRRRTYRCPQSRRAPGHEHRDQCGTPVSAWVGQLSAPGSPWGYLLVGLLTAAEAAAFLGLVIPGETAMLLGGVLVATGHAQLGWILAAAMLGAVMGDSGRLRVSAAASPSPSAAAAWGLRIGPERWKRAGD